jgi:hypothetical protein
MANRNTRIRGVQIKDGDIGLTQLTAGIGSSLGLADSALQAGDIVGLYTLPTGGIPFTDLVGTDISITESQISDLGAYLESVAFTALSDTPGAYAGNALKVVRVNAGADGLEYATLTDTVGILESAVDVEDLTGNADTSLTLANAPVAGSLQLFINGLLQEEGSGKDYTISGVTITLAVASEVDDIIIAHYIDAV